ncbi:hypothetical protein [Stenotrophomonas sp. YIM B13575]|uniref:hypothetical protein n=1 Tax=Stenotrophomonas sp. YIM B13575 TaxID=3366314 RepID=UPI00367ABDDF
MAWIYQWVSRFIAMAHLVGLNLGSHGFGMQVIHAWRGSTNGSPGLLRWRIWWA